MMCSEQIGVFRSAAGHIEYGAAARVNLTQELCKLVRLGRVILAPRVDQVVELGGLAQHVTSP